MSAKGWSIVWRCLALAACATTLMLVFAGYAWQAWGCLLLALIATMRFFYWWRRADA